MQHYFECPHCGKSLQVSIEEIPLLHIALLTSLHFNVPLSQMNSASRKRACVTARHAYFTLASIYTKSSFKEIGEQVSRHHSTVIKDKQAFLKDMERDPPLKEKFTSLENKVLLAYTKFPKIESHE